MAATFTYYAILNPRFSTVDSPAGLVRRVQNEQGFHDEALHKDLAWHPSATIVDWEQGETSTNLVEISEEQAQSIIEGFQERWANL